MVVSGYDKLHEVLVKNGRAFAGRPIPFTRQVYLLSPNDLVYCDPSAPQWQSMKNATHRMMRNNDKMLEFMNNVMTPFVQECMKKVTSYKGQEIDVKDDQDDCIIKISIVLLIGKTPKDKDVFVKEMKELNELVLASIAATRGADLDYFPWQRYFGHPLYSHLLKICKVRDRLYDRLLEECKDIYDSNAEGPFFMQSVNQLLDKSSPHYNAAVSDENARGLFIDLLMASTASSTNFLYALINILLHNPRVIKRLQQEIDAVIGDRQPTVSDQSKLPYAMASIYELMRYTSLVPTLPHKTTEDVLLGGYSLPAGTVTLPMFLCLNNDETFWKTPFEF